LTFRKPKRSDLLGSHLRKFIFKGLDSREINLALLRELDTEQAERYILRDKHNALGDLQRKQGFHHWEGTLHEYIFSLGLSIDGTYSNA